MESNKRIIIYQLLPRLFANLSTANAVNGTYEQNGSGKMNNISMAILKRIHDLGVSHVWFTGVLRHASTTDYSAFGIPCQHAEIVKGKAGSPYAVTDYYDIDPDLAVNVPDRKKEWEALIVRTHKSGMKVIMDFVPNHVAREYQSVCKPKGIKDLGECDDVSKSFSPDNNFYYCSGVGFDPLFDKGNYEEFPAKATGNDVFNNRPNRNDWYETVKLNYGIEYLNDGRRDEHFSPIPDTWLKMTDILLYWAEKGVDGFRCDMAEMVPAAFWEWATARVKRDYPHIIFIGEVYNPAEYRHYIASGFDYLYDKVGMYDCLRDVVAGHRAAADITYQWQQTDDIRQHMLYFLENHDEQRIASEFFAADALKAIPAVVVSTLFGENPFMVYAGQEFGEKGMDAEGYSGRDGRTTIFDYWTVETLRRGYFDRSHMTKAERLIEKTYKKILNIAATEIAITAGKSFDLMYVNSHVADNLFAFLRRDAGETIFVVANFSDKDERTAIKIPAHAFEYLSLSEGIKKAIDLLNDEEVELNLIVDGCVNLNVKPHSAVVYKMEG